MSEITIKDSNYRVRKLTAFQQFHIARRLAPALFAFVKSAAAMEGRVVSEKDSTEAVMADAFKPIAEVLSRMSDEDSEYVMKTCMGACDRQQPGGWQQVMLANGRMQFEDIDLATMMQLSMAVIKENLGDFFPAPPAA